MTYPASYPSSYPGSPAAPAATATQRDGWAQLIVEAGLVTSSPVQGGTTFILDSSVLGTGTLGDAITWTDISADVTGFTITRPSTRLQGPLWNYQAGTASITLDNSAGSYDPDNLAGPYVSAGVTQLTAMVPVRARAVFGPVAYSLYSGFADGWMPAQVTYEGGYAELVLPATDAFKVLAGITLAQVAVEGAGADTGARIRDILARAGWYTSGERRLISTGNSTLQGTTLGDTALNLMQLATDSEIGQLYVNGAGAVVFRARRDLLADARSATPQAVFGDLPGTIHPAGTELACAAIGRASDDTTIANDIQATRAGGTLQEARDAVSIAKYLFPRTYARSDLILQDDTTALNWAQWVLYVSKGGEDRFESLQVDPQADPANLWPQVLGREIGDRIQVWHRPAGTASPITKDCFIAGITHAWDSVTSAWLTTWTLQSADKYGSFFTLDNPVTGQLDSNALTFLGRLMPIPTWAVGQVLAANDVNQWFVPLAAYKSTPQGVSNTTLVNDSQLVLPVAASATYFFFLYLSYDGGTQGSADMKFQFTGPAGASASFSYIYYPTSGGVGANVNISRTTALATPVPIGTDGSGVLLMALMTGTFTTSSTSGSFQFQFSQNTTNGTPTIVHTGSALLAHRIG